MRKDQVGGYKGGLLLVRLVSMFLWKRKKEASGIAVVDIRFVRGCAVVQSALVCGVRRMGFMPAVLLPLYGHSIQLCKSPSIISLLIGTLGVVAGISKGMYTPALIPALS